jgi:hypothetical protein
MHVLSIVQMLYLSRKPLSVHKHGDEDYIEDYIVVGGCA